MPPTGRRRYDPDLTEVVLQIKLNTSPTLSLSNPDATLDLTLSLRISKTEHPQEPITIMTDKSAFQPFILDTIEHNPFGILVALDSNNQPTDKKIRLGSGLRVHYAYKDINSLDLRDHGHEFLTIPGDGREVTVTQHLSWERIFRYEEKLCQDDLRPGERFAIELNPYYVGTYWWCLGDLKGELKDKKFHYGEADQFEDPPDDILHDENWVLGRDPDALQWKMKKSDRNVIFEIVE
ncbi:hypothetical protein DV735_g3433, partial [Chaetothyriales sp. CBS 134920]